MEIKNYWDGPTPCWNAKQAIAYLVGYDFRILRQKGSHVQMQSSDGEIKMTIPYHGSGAESLKKNIVMQIIRRTADLRYRMDKSMENKITHEPGVESSPIISANRAIPKLDAESLKQFMRTRCYTRDRQVKSTDVAGYFDEPYHMAIYYLNKLKDRGVIYSPMRGHWTFTEKGMIVVGLEKEESPELAPAIPRILDLPVEPVDNSEETAAIAEDIPNDESVMLHKKWMSSSEDDVEMWKTKYFDMVDKYEKLALAIVIHKQAVDS